MKNYTHRVNRFFVMLIIVQLVSLMFVMTVNAQSQDKIVAIVDGRTITQKEVDQVIVSQILPLEQQIYAVRKATLDNLVTRALLEQAAKKKGISVEELKKQLTAGKIEVSQAQVEQLFLENASVFASMSPDEAKERLRLDLENQGRMKLYRDAVAELKKNSNIDLRLDEPRLPPVVSDLRNAPTTGAGDALITIVEFSDFQCPFCRGTQTTLKQVLQAFRNEVKLVFKHLPLDIHADAFPSAQAAFCAGDQGLFWEYQDSLFAAPDLSQKTLTRIASERGLSLPKFNACLNSEASRAAVLNDVQEARRLGINSTPTFIVNGKLVSGAIGFEDFKAIIQRELKIARIGSRTQ